MLHNLEINNYTLKNKKEIDYEIDEFMHFVSTDYYKDVSSEDSTIFIFSNGSVVVWNSIRDDYNTIINFIISYLKRMNPSEKYEVIESDDMT